MQANKQCIFKGKAFAERSYVEIHQAIKYITHMYIIIIIIIIITSTQRCRWMMFKVHLKCFAFEAIYATPFGQFPPVIAMADQRRFLRQQKLNNTAINVFFMPRS